DTSGCEEPRIENKACSSRLFHDSVVFECHSRVSQAPDRGNDCQRSLSFSTTFNHCDYLCHRTNFFVSQITVWNCQLELISLFCMVSRVDPSFQCFHRGASFAIVFPKLSTSLR